MRDETKLVRFADVQETALYYAQLGFKVVPVAAGKKAPDGRLAPHGFKDGTSDLSRIQEWLRRGLANVGLVTGYDPERGWGIVVVDFDPRSGGDPERFPLPLPTTLRVHTGGGGWHYYYRIDRPLRSWKAAQGVDVKADGGYVVAPPSRTSGVYEVVEGSFEEIAPAPAWVYERSLEVELGAGQRYLEGMRHNAVLSYAVRVRRGGADDAELYRKVESFNKSRCAPPLPEGEVERILRWVVQNVAPGVAKAKQKRGGDLDEAKEVLFSATWAWYRGLAYIVDGNMLISAASANVYLLERGYKVGRERVKDLVEMVLYRKQIDELKGIVLGDSFVYGRAGQYEGLWAHRDGVLILITSDGIQTFAPDAWPQGVYRLSGSGFRHKIEVFEPVGSGKYIDDFRVYFKVLSRRLNMDWRIAASMLLPALFSQGNAGFIFSGPAGAGKSMFARGLAYLQRGQEWSTPVGTHARDYLAMLANNKIVFFDDSHYLDKDLQSLLKTTITTGEAEVRSLYTNFNTERRKLSGSVIINTTSIEDLMADFVDRCFYITFEKRKGSLREDKLEEFFESWWQRALLGAIELFQRASKVEVPSGLLPQVRFRQWLSWAYRYAVVLGVADEFVKHVKLSKIAAYRTLKYSFLIDLFADEKIESGKAYTFAELYDLSGAGDEDERARLGRGLKGQKNKREIETIAEAFQYRTEFFTMREESSRQNRLYIKFVKLDEDEFIEDIEQIIKECYEDEHNRESSADSADDVPF